MTTPPNPDYSMWGMPPTLAKRYEPTSDIVSLVMWNLNNSKGLTLKTSRPYVVFTRLVNQVATGISAREINEALSNMILCGTSVVERITELFEGSHQTDSVKFMFYLEYEDAPDLPMDKPHEVDPKQVISWPEDFRKMEALLLQGNNSSSPVAGNGKQIPI